MQKKKKISIIVFPGSNCDRDLIIATEKCLGLTPKVIWHNETHIKHSDMILIPGGFSFGDYLRAGTIATKSPAIKEVIRSQKGKKQFDLDEILVKTAGLDTEEIQEYLDEMFEKHEKDLIAEQDSEHTNVIHFRPPTDTKH